MSAPFVEQRSEDWHLQRAGKITASRMGDVMGTPSARAKYMRELGFERLAGVAKHSASGKALAWGIDLEPYAKQAIEIETGLIIRPAEFKLHPAYPFIGASADGLIDPDGGWENKCPHDEAVHMQALLDGMPAEHMPQVQAGMAVHGRAWWLFTSYDPRQAEPYRLYTQRVERDEAYIARMVAACRQFEEELQRMVDEIRERRFAA